MNIRMTLLAVVVITIVTPLAMLAQRPHTKTMKRIPDTGQTGDFTSAPGEDSDVRINTPSYIIEADVVIDTITGLMWQRADGGEMAWDKGASYCENLVLDGFSDWRMPTSFELFSIHDLGRKNPALPQAFTSTGAEYWWSADPLVGDNARVFATNSGGGIGPHQKSETISSGGTKKFHVRAVRALQPPVNIPVHFTDMGGDVVRDNSSELMWQQYCHPQPLTWEDALRVADTLTLGGFTDWRMPNIKELHAIREQQEKGPCVDLLYFPCVASTTTLWSSTTLISQNNDQAWTLKSDLGVITYDKKNLKLKLLCVRGGSPDVTSVDDQRGDAEMMTVYPNPTSGRITFSQPVVRAELFDALGTRVLVGLGTDMDVSSLPKGSYYCQLIDDRGRSATVMIIKH
ncbi:MAG: hypothetical protein RIR53_11 [Bacteroidota bacterium]